MVRSFFERSWPLLAAAIILLLVLALVPTRAAAPRAQGAFFSMLFPQLMGGEATPAEAVAL